MHIRPTDVYDGEIIDIRQPIYSPYVLAKSAGLSLDTENDPLVYGPILRDNFRQFVDGFEQNGVDIRPTLAASFLVNLLTEDNLPYYAEKNLTMASESEPLTKWAKEWIAEEDSHGTLMRDYALLTGIIGPKDNTLIRHNTYHQGRTKQLRTGTDISPGDNLEAFHYLTLQELLTVRAHDMLSWMLDQSGVKVFKPMIGDENNHYQFYRKLSRATLDNSEFTDTSLMAMNKVYSQFEMPGSGGIPRFRTLASRIAVSGIFDIITIAESKKAIINRLDIGNIHPKTDFGKRAQTELLTQVSDETISQQRLFMEDLKDQVLEKTNEGTLKTFILGRTVEFEYSKTTPPRKLALIVV